MKRVIEIDGVMERVWRCRESVSIRTAGVFPFAGGDLGKWLRSEPAASGKVPRDHQLELLLTDEVLLCMADEAMDVIAIDTKRGEVTMESGAVIPARISRRTLFPAEEGFVQNERLIEGWVAGKSPGNAGGDKLSPPRREVCVVCGWEHDAGFARIEIPGRAAIELYGAMAQIVALVHAAQASGAGAVSTKDVRLLKICGGYRHPCKVFDDRKRSGDYKMLFETGRRGFVGLRRWERGVDG